MCDDVANEPLCQWTKRYRNPPARVNNVTMCMHEQCVPNLAVPPWRPGYEPMRLMSVCTCVLVLSILYFLYNHVNFMCTLTTYSDAGE